jgi:hypothetical protein
MKFKGYCFTNEGERMPHVDLEGETEVFQYICLQQNAFPRVMITDSLSDVMVLEIQDCKIVFPEELQGNEPWKDNSTV